MNNILQQMLLKYNAETTEDKKNAVKEIVQEIILCGLSRGGFFQCCAFYGETALRIFYGLDRFSEDLDFCLVKPDKNFDIKKYFMSVKNEVKSLGLDFELTEKEKFSDSNVKSAFVKGNTKECLISIYDNFDEEKIIPKNESIKIKFKVDINPPEGAHYENKFGLLPSPYIVRICDLPTLFAGKIHACICRNWKSRVKGRDFYDYIFFLSMGIRVNIDNLKAKLVQSGYIEESFVLTIESLKKMLNDRFENVDFVQAKEDVYPFIKDKSKLDVWNVEFFKSITENLY